MHQDVLEALSLPPRRAGVRGPVAVRASLIAAASELFAARDTSSVSVREIAEAAGVNHGLVHHYFGSKQGLIDAVLDDLGRRAARALDAGLDLSPTGPLARYVLVASKALTTSGDTAGKTSQQSAVALVRRLGQLGTPPVSDEARLRTARLAATFIGWLLFEPVLLRAAGLDDLDPAAVRHQLLESALS